MAAPARGNRFVSRREATARDAIIANIRASLRRTGPLADTVRAALDARMEKARPNLQPAVDGDLAERFVARLTAVSGIVTRIESLTEVADVVSSHLHKYSLPGELVVAPDPALDDIVWPNTLGIRRGRCAGDDSVSLTGAFAGIAETGTLMLLSGAHGPTTLNFLPDDHLVVLRESALVRHAEDAWAKLRTLGQGMPRTVNLVTGPSKSADVEQEYIQEGAHGPAPAARAAGRRQERSTGTTCWRGDPRHARRRHRKRRDRLVFDGTPPRRFTGRRDRRLRSQRTMGSLYGDQRYLFILGHMRGYTTLLAHILGSHPQVRGYAEQHLCYDSLGALKTLRRRIEYEAFAGKRTGRHYLLDKLLHNELALARFVSASPNVFLIVMLREPLATLRSLRGLMPHWSENDAVDYYTHRTAGLLETVDGLATPTPRAIFLDADRLLTDTPDTLRRLARFLGLDEPLSERYRLFRLSGVTGVGDPSTRLRAGYIVRAPMVHDVRVSGAAARSVVRSHARCRAGLPGG